MGLSFSIPSKSSSRPTAARTPQTFHEDGGANSGSAQPEYVTEFDPSKPLSSEAGCKPVIAPIPNSQILLRPAKKMKNLFLPDDDDPSQSQTHFVLDSSASDPAASAIPYGLTIRPNAGPHLEEDHSSEDLIVRRYKEDMETLPDDRGFEEFADIDVEDFGAALLAGYGWSEGKGIGRNAKGDTKVVRFGRRANTEGLGYVPEAANATKRKNRRTVPVAEPAVPVEAEKVVRIVSGKHAGLKGKVLERLRDRMIVLKLLQSGEEVRMGLDMIAELGSSEEEKFLRKLRGLEVRSNDERRESSWEERRGRDNRRDEKVSEDGKDRQVNGSHHKSSGGSREREREKKVSEDGKDRQVNGSHHKSSGGSREREREKVPVRWLMSHIRVRIISKDFKGGRLYLKKGKVVDVVGPTTCDISMDESGELLQSVNQEILETVLPKRGGSVLVLYGKHKGVYGSLVERDTEEETGVVRDADTHASINVRLEQIAEYIGDPSYIGY